ncbi:MAG: glycosyltransferase [Chitinophagia bacterium]|nr:glycosyltransferase [Chitinophagia bacterium]
MEPKSIAFLCHPYHRGGVTRWMADAAIYLSNKGYSIYFVAPSPTIVFFSARGREPMVQLFAKEPNKVQVVTTNVGREFEFGTFEYRTFIYKQLLCNVPLGVPVIVSDDAAVWAAACGLHNSFPIVGVLHADDKAYYELSIRYQKEVSVFVSVANRVDRVFKEQCPGIDARRLFTIPCGINLPPIPVPRPVNAQLEVLYVGRIERGQKRTEDLLAVASALKSNGTPFHLTIIGDGAEVKPIMEQKVNELNLSAEVAFTGWLSQQQVLQRMATADALILVSNYEGMPISMMEALGSGCGFAGTRVSGIEDYEFHQLAPQCFRVFDIGDTQTAAVKLKELGEVPVTARQQAARALAEDQFSMDRCLDRYLEAIATIPARQYTATKVQLSLKDKLKSRVLSALRAARMQGKRA